ncbi:hypothetical protein C7974DRAFT_415904 [Boeremia exigua]|uniref:uncharacterized protein n=1 Tax=Boeremia exigua TaxID=749465 RepID=UPI001E8E79B5|nr:uncharacterized protein C7974DRAFT_415904 [Boeremia exigua]KAH6618533.1 hypothetical protein C7974DRAFT_415904 [Boeremia exigua]
MVHGSVREREAFQQPPQSAYYQQTQPRAYPVSASVAPSLYTAQPQHPQQVEYQYQRQRPQSPPSPPAEEQKPSLPSISSLLEFAGGEKPASDAAAASPQSQHRQSSSPQLGQSQQSIGTMQRPQQPSTYVAAPTVTNNTRMTLPPTPPMHPDAAGDGQRSPSSASTHSAASAAYFMGASLNNMEPHQQRQVLSSMPTMKRDSIPSHSMSPYSGSMYAQSPYQSSPGNASASSFYSPEQHSYNNASMYAQRPLPSNYQPTMPLPMPQPNSATANANPWQHHHYISTSSQSAFPQSQDRYICSTCNKAFSRPSSLRIHSHSHTGEKPYKCPQSGCGKAFSVRSNMKRHERGCHASTSTTITT